VNGQAPAQAAAHAFVTGCVNRGISASSAVVPAEHQLGAVREMWADVARAANAAQDVPGQVRLAREDRDQLRRAVLDLAADLEDEAERNDCACESKTGNAAAARLRKIAEPPS